MAVLSSSEGTSPSTERAPASPWDASALPTSPTAAEDPTATDAAAVDAPATDFSPADAVRLLEHAMRCDAPPGAPCGVAGCEVMRNLLAHARACDARTSCGACVPCASLRGLMRLRLDGLRDSGECDAADQGRAPKRAKRADAPAIKREGSFDAPPAPASSSSPSLIISIKREPKREPSASPRDATHVKRSPSEDDLKDDVKDRKPKPEPWSPFACGSTCLKASQWSPPGHPGTRARGAQLKREPSEAGPASALAGLPAAQRTAHVARLWRQAPLTRALCDELDDALVTALRVAHWPESEAPAEDAASAPSDAAPPADAPADAPDTARPIAEKKGGADSGELADFWAKVFSTPVASQLTPLQFKAYKSAILPGVPVDLSVVRARLAALAATADDAASASTSESESSDDDMSDSAASSDYPAPAPAARCEFNSYRCVDDVAAHVDLVVRNALAFNGPAHTVTRAAAALGAAFEAELARVGERLAAAACSAARSGACALCGGHYVACGDAPVPPVEGMPRAVRDAIPEGPVEGEWVQCDWCARWEHTVCALATRCEERAHACAHCVAASEGTSSGGASPPRSGCGGSPPSSAPRPSLALPPAFAGAPPPLCAAALPTCALSELLETSVRAAAPDAAGALTVRVLSSVAADFEPPAALRAHVGADTRFGAVARCVALFEQIDGVDVLCFVAYWREAAADAPERNRGHAQLTYLDSAAHFAPAQARGRVHRALVGSLLGSLGARGFKTVSIWACPPARGDDYVLLRKPFNPQLPLGGTPARAGGVAPGTAPAPLAGWYRRICEEHGLRVSDTYSAFVDGSKRAQSIERLPVFADEPWLDAFVQHECPVKVAGYLKKFAKELLVVHVEGAGGACAAEPAPPAAHGAGGAGPFDCRARLLAIQRERGLRFETLAHAKFSTLVLLQCHADAIRLSSP